MALFTILITVAFLFLIKYLFDGVRSMRTMSEKLDQFPRRKGLPLLGNIDDLLGGDRVYVFNKLRRLASEHISKGYGIVSAWLITLPSIVIFSAQEAEIVFSSNTNITKGITYKPLYPWLGNGLLTSTGEQWRQRRKLLTPAFHFKILRKYFDIMVEGSKELVKEIDERVEEEINVVPILGKHTLNVVCETAMGISLRSIKDNAKYYAAIHEICEIIVKRNTYIWMMIDFIYFFTPTYWRQCKILGYLHKFSMDVIKQRKLEFDANSIKREMEEESENSFTKRKFAMLDILLLAQLEDASISDEDIREEVDTFMFEGHDTTAMALSYLLMLLANNRYHQDKIFDEISSLIGNKDPTYAELQEFKYLEMCIKESLRLYPSVPLVVRTITKDYVTKSGKVVPVGVNCNLAIMEIHNRDDFYPNPSMFDPDRFLPANIAARHPYAYVPFSAGPRNCIGQKFAMMELKCAVISILQNFILVPIDTPETIQILLDLVLRPRSPIRIKFVRRETTI